MKQVTLAELAEMAKNDKALEQKILEGSKKIQGGESYSDALKTLAAELGYELTLEKPLDHLEMITDSDLEQVSGGREWYNDFCIFINNLFGLNGEEECAEE